MPPKGKSSASSGTRKKHARKAAAAHGAPEEPQQPKEKKPKGKDKKSKKESRKKVYIPPVKPAPVQPDPRDTLGLAQKLPPELLIVLRLLSKKDATTKRRALEELQSSWISKARRGGDDEYLVYTLHDVIPVWVRRNYTQRFAAGSLVCSIENSCITSLPSSCTLHDVSDCLQLDCTPRYYRSRTYAERSVSRYARSPLRTTQSLSSERGV